FPEQFRESLVKGPVCWRPNIEDMKRSSDKLFCCRWVRHRVPAAHREELYHILRMTGPLLLSRILNYLLPFVVTMFCGRLGNNVMAGYGLASATINVTTAATGCGLGLACDTLVSQTFGGKNLLRVGVILQRGIIILLLFCLPCWALLINTQSILLCLGQDPDVARIAQLYITLFLPAVPAMFLHHLQVSYLQNQGIILPQMYTAAVANIANVLTNYILVHWLDLGVSGSAAANTLSQIYICIFLFAYIQWKKLHANTWGGWSAESLQEWGSYMKLAIPSALMKCFEWWVYEFGGFFAGMLSEDELAAQHAVMMVAAITYMFPFGIQAAACARVGNALGAGDSGRAILSSKVSLTLAGCIAILEGLLLASVKTLCAFMFQSVCTGIFLGTGRQRIPAVANFIGYYCIGLSLSITLMFVAKLRVLGFWLGLLICVVLQSTFYIILIFKLDWEKMTDEAVKRARKHSEDTLLSPVTTTLGDSTTGRTSNELIVRNAFLFKCKINISYIKCTFKILQRIHHCGLNGNRLSNTQLIFRRGLTMFAVAALLAIGTSVHFLVPLPEIPSKNSSTTQWINTTYAPDQILTNILVGNEEPE
uniref:Multidrug and toxin extrusion protein n=1 Tax=Gouania willdenowi TaxID=441366 RepID=A0A8C5G3R3_GOUWI